MKNPPHIVIIGAGFGGLWASRAFRRAAVRVTLIDRNNYHGFWPLLYQVAAAELDAEQIAYPAATHPAATPSRDILPRRRAGG
jgi:NADH:ubiquinone reductase (H+-translocating)